MQRRAPPLLDRRFPLVRSHRGHDSLDVGGVFDSLEALLRPTPLRRFRRRRLRSARPAATAARAADGGGSGSPLSLGLQLPHHPLHLHFFHSQLLRPVVLVQLHQIFHRRRSHLFPQRRLVFLKLVFLQPNAQVVGGCAVHAKRGVSRAPLIQRYLPVAVDVQASEERAHQLGIHAELEATHQDLVGVEVTVAVTIPLLEHRVGFGRRCIRQHVLAPQSLRELVHGCFEFDGRVRDGVVPARHALLGAENYLHIRRRVRSAVPYRDDRLPFVVRQANLAERPRRRAVRLRTQHHEGLARQDGVLNSLRPIVSGLQPILLFAHEHGKATSSECIRETINRAVATQRLRASLRDAIADHYLRHVSSFQGRSPPARAVRRTV